jgi:hypothetical protein
MHVNTEVARGDGPSVLAPDVERSLVAQLTRDVLAEAAPEETEVFAKDEAGWVDGTHQSAGPHDDMTGFGAEAFALVLTPYVVSAATAAIRYLAGVLGETADAELRPRIARWVSRLFGHDEAKEEDVVPGLPVDVVRRVREVTLRTCRDMGLPEDDAALVSDTVAGRLVLPTG